MVVQHDGRIPASNRSILKEFLHRKPVHEGAFVNRDAPMVIRGRGTLLAGPSIAGEGGKGMHVADQTLTSYVPAYVARCAAAGQRQVTPPCVHTFAAAVLLADISGFTALSENLAARGPAGSEQLSTILNTYFGRLIDHVVAHGGDIVTFTGDGLLAVWQVEGGPDGLFHAAHRAARCGLAAQHDLSSAVNERVEGAFTMRMSIGAGDCAAMFLGGAGGSCEHLVTGPPVIGAAEADRHARPGDVVLTRKAADLLGGSAKGSRLPEGCRRLTELRSDIPCAPAPPLRLQPRQLRRLTPYIPRPVLARSGSAHSEWLGELRQVTAVFLRLAELEHSAWTEEAQWLVRTVQEELFKYEAVINKIGIDNKGVSLLAALGLPPISHDDDPSRAVRAAMAVKARLDREGWRGALGLATGRVFCGVVGNDRRREYTLLGNVVNLAARLMQNGPQAILCDETTRQLSSGRIAFEALPAIMVRGLVEPVQAYRPRALRALRDPGHSSEIVGRDAEREALMVGIRALYRGVGGAIIIEGEPGIGKSCLAQFAAEHCRMVGVTLLRGNADSVERQRPYHAWRDVFTELLDLGSLTDAGDRRTQVLRLLGENSEWVGEAPLLNDVIDLALPENVTTSGLSGVARAERTLALLCGILQRAASHSRIVVILEDAHWFDSASWALLGRVLRQVQPLLQIVAMRPVEALPEDYLQLRSHPNCAYLRLSALSADDIESVARRRLGVESLPGPVAALVCSKAEGNPFLAEELACSLRDHRLLEIIEGVCVLSCRPEELQAQPFPESVQGVITNRIDGLTPSQQLTLKVASVIGRTFQFQTLYDAYPVEEDKPDLMAHLSVLESLDITPLETPLPNLSYMFKHIITRDVSYDLMLYSQRQQLHGRVADWYERTYSENLSPHFALLASHWVAAQVYPKAVFYLHRAGKLAARSYANREAESFLRQALEHVPSLPEDAGRDQQELDIQLALAPVLLVTQGQGSGDARRAYDRARGLCETLDQTPELAGALFGLWAYYLFHGELAAASEVTRDLLALAMAVGDADLRLQANFAAGNTCFWMGDLRESAAHVDEVIHLHDPSRHAEYIARYAQDPRVTCRTFGCLATWMLGYPDRALAEGREALARSEELSHPYSIALSIQALALVHQLRGEPEATRERALELAAISREHGFPPYALLSDLLLAWVSALNGRPEEAIPAIRKGIDDWRAMGVELVQTYYATLLAEACHLAGRAKEALAVIDDALRLAHASGELAFEPELRRWRGTLLLGASPESAAEGEAELRKSLADARRQGARMLELKIATSLAAFRKDRKDSEESRASLQNIVAWFTEGFDTAQLREATRLLLNPEADL